MTVESVFVGVGGQRPKQVQSQRIKLEQLGLQTDRPIKALTASRLVRAVRC